MAGAAQDNDDEIVGINVTPLVDVTLVLLIIFMVTANFIVRETEEVDVPSVAGPTNQTPEGPLMIVLNKEAQLFFDGAPLDEAGLQVKLREAVAKDKEARAVITADQALNYGKVMHLIDVVKTEGISKFALNIEKEAAAAPTPAPPP